MWLTVSNGPDAGASVEVTGSRFVIGREEGCDLVLSDEEVSRQHAYLSLLPDGSAEIHDLGSSNGTRVDGSVLRGPVVLRGGETIDVGETRLTVGAGSGAARTRVRPAVAADGTPEAGKARKVPTAALVAGGLAVVAIVGLGAIFLAGGDDEPSVADVVADTRASVVRVNSTDADGLGGSGTGWVLDAEQGLIVTNHHVVNAGSLHTVGVPKSGDAGDAENAPLEERDATIVGTAPCEDLAVIKTDPEGLRTMPLGDQGALKQGDDVIVVGYPGTQSQRADYIQTDGTVSDVKTSFSSDQLRTDVPNLTNLVLTTAKINPGNSGGPLMDTKGRLVGVATGSDDQLDQNYAIGADQATKVIDELRRGVSIGWTGMGLEFKPSLKGAIVTNVVPGTPAATAGIRPPQLLVSINGQRLDGTLANYCSAVQGLPRRASIRAGLLQLQADPSDPAKLSVAEGATIQTLPIALK